MDASSRTLYTAHVVASDDASESNPVQPTGAAIDRARSSRLAAVLTCTQAKEALVGMGWKPKIATAAVQAAASALGENVAIEKLIFEALRRCPRPAR
jgi:hypothetical protein